MSGDDFTAFVAHSGPRLLRYAVLLCGDRGEAEDLLQETLVRVYPRWRRLREQQPEAYVRRALTNRAVSRWRPPWHRRRVDGVPELAVPGDEPGRATGSPCSRASCWAADQPRRAARVSRYPRSGRLAVAAAAAR